jgi:hypothetical protein
MVRGASSLTSAVPRSWVPPTDKEASAVQSAEVRRPLALERCEKLSLMTPQVLTHPHFYVCQPSKELSKLDDFPTPNHYLHSFVEFGLDSVNRY